MKRKNLLKAVLALGMVLALWPLGRPVQAAPYTVTNTNDSGAGSLRQAIINANAAGADIIDFNIPMTDPGCNAGTGVCTIQPASALPTLTDDDTTIGGYTQTGAAPATATTPAALKIELDGSKAGSASGLRISSADNVIAGLAINRFEGNGISISGSGATGNVIQGNHIGTDANGTANLGNDGSGVHITGAENAIGGDMAAKRNIISGNGMYGVSIEGSDAISNTISGNYIGTDASGTSVLSNAITGIDIYNAQNNTIGGDRNAGEGNVISGNAFGVNIEGSDAMGNIVIGNHIGTDVNGTADLGNLLGVEIDDGAHNNTVGGTTAGAGNIISGNDGHGISISNSDDNTVAGNAIGTNVGGTLDLGNTGGGVYIRSGAQNNTITQNVISGNNIHGIEIRGSTTMSNTVLGNYIGTDASGTSDLGNTLNGVWIGNGAQNNTIGGNTAGERNVISGNEGSGVSIRDSDTMSNTVSGNYIGTDASGTLDLGNTGGGVYIGSGAQSNTIAQNVISGNNFHGIEIRGSTTMSNTVLGNYIGTDESGTLDLGNTNSGVFIYSGAHNNTIGGDRNAGEGNVISGNGWEGVRISGTDTMSNTVSGNYIGLAANGTDTLGNGRRGIRIHDGAQNNTIGGTAAGERNIISGNSGNGIWITDSDGNAVLGNYIGTDVSGTLDLGNDEHGVAIWGDAQSNTVGPDNVIAHNSLDGVDVQEGNPSGNIFTQNSIFSNTMGIDLWPGANGGIAAPTILTTTVGSVNIGGYVSACPSCTVEVFENSDTDGEGETYVGHTIADGSGHFTVTVSYLTKPYLTATATDVVSGTSEFSDVFTATVELSPPVGPVYLPIIMRNY